MTISSISSSSLTTVLSQSVNTMQTQLADAELELSTGQDADVGLTLGAQTGQDISLQKQQTQLQTLTTTNGTASTRLSTTQSTLSSMQSTAQSLMDSIISTQNNETSAPSLVTSATADLQSLISSLNSTLGGNYLFAGTNTSTAPITDYFATGSQTAAAVNSAISTGLPADLSTVSGSDMTTFLTGTFSNMFTGDWSTATGSGWSSASDQVLTSEISPSVTEPTSVSANETPFRQLAEAYTMVSSLGNQSLGSDAYTAVMTQASSLLQSAINSMTDMQSNLGIVQSTITSSNTQMSAQMSIMSTQVDDLQNADAYDAATKVSNLQTQIETSYSLTNQLKQLSLVNYIS